MMEPVTATFVDGGYPDGYLPTFGTLEGIGPYVAGVAVSGQAVGTVSASSMMGTLEVVDDG